MTWQIWLAIASIVFIVFGLVKRLETRMLLIVAGFILCCASGAPMKAFGAFVKGMTNITLVPAICSAMGFAFAVQASKCDQHLVAAVAAPLKKLGGLLIPAATILTFLINIAIMSAAGTAATAGATFIPLLLRAGIRPAAAAAAKDTHFQFERTGYFVTDRVDHTAEQPVFNLAVGLRDSWGKNAK